jgi:hypothetical protein
LKGGKKMGTDKKQTREITYRVGMQKGRIQYDDSGKMLSHQSNHSLIDHKWVKWTEQILWRERFVFPSKFAFFFMLLLPVVSLAMTLWLIINLLVIN